MAVIGRRGRHRRRRPGHGRAGAGGAGPDPERDRHLVPARGAEPVPHVDDSRGGGERTERPARDRRGGARRPGHEDLDVGVQCSRPCPERGPYAFTGVALTTDGYATATYLRAQFPDGTSLEVTTPQDGLFLVVDTSNGREWLVDVAGDRA